MLRENMLKGAEGKVQDRPDNFVSEIAHVAVLSSLCPLYSTAWTIRDAEYTSERRAACLSRYHVVLVISNGVQEYHPDPFVGSKGDVTCASPGRTTAKWNSSTMDSEKM